MKELLKQEEQLRQLLIIIKQEETVLGNKLNAIRAKINNNRSKLKKILEEKEEIMVEEDTFIDDKVGIEIGNTKFVFDMVEPSRLLSPNMAQSKYENSQYDITLQDISSQLAYRFVEATKKWVATKAPNPKRMLIPKADLVAMIRTGDAILKKK